MKKSIISIFLAVMMTVLCAVPVFSAQADYTFTADVDDSSVKTGEKIKVSLKITRNDGGELAVYTMQDYVGFDTSLFKYVEGTLEVSDGYTATVQDGCVYVNRYSTNALKYTDDTATIMTFELEAVAAGTAQIKHSVVEMVGPKLVIYSVDLKGTSVTVEKDEGSVTPPPSVPEVERYDIDVPSRISHGDIAVSHRTAKKGTTVKIIVDADAGYELDDLVVSKSNGKTVKLTRKSDSTYTFIMPEDDVEIFVSFVKVKVEDDDDKPGTTPGTTPGTDPGTTPGTDPGTTPGTEPGVHVCPSEAYTDVDQTKWYHNAIDYVITNGLMNGMSADTFAPDVTTSRAMIATILWRQQGQPTVGGDMPFTDVPAGQWYTEAVRWAAEKGIVNGYGNGLFGPNDTITREQFATMLYRYEKTYGKGLENGWEYKLVFTDADSVSSWAYEAMCWCNMNGIINGMGDGILLPQGNATRAQAAQILMNYNSKK